MALLLGVTEANDWGWGSPATIGLLVGGVAVLGVWLKVEATVAQPLIELRVLRGRAVAATNLTGLLVGFAMFSSFLLIPQFAQAPESTGYGFGFSITQAGLILTPAAVAQLLAGPLAGRLGVVVGFRATLAGGAGLASAAFLWLAFEHGHPWNFIVSSALLGAGISFAMASMANLIVAAVPQQEVGIATGINTVTRTVGGAFGAGRGHRGAHGQRDRRQLEPHRGGIRGRVRDLGGGGMLALAAALMVPREVDREAAPAAEPAAAPSSLAEAAGSAGCARRLPSRAVRALQIVDLTGPAEALSLVDLPDPGPTHMLSRRPRRGDRRARRRRVVPRGAPDARRVPAQAAAAVRARQRGGGRGAQRAGRGAPSRRATAWPPAACSAASPRWPRRPSSSPSRSRTSSTTRRARA